MTLASDSAYPPQADAVDRALLDQAAAESSGADFSAQYIAQVAGARGLDVATAILYAHFRASLVHGTMMRLVEGAPPASSPEPATVVIVPGAFHRHHPHTGAAGERLIEAARQLGWPPAETIRVSSLGSLQRNADALIEHLGQSHSSRIVVASLSKGSADVATALRTAGDAQVFANVVGWVNISGLVFGTPLIHWLRRQPLRVMGVHLLLWIKGLRFAPLDELRWGTGSPLDLPLPIPAHLRLLNVLGVPLQRHLRHPWAPKGYRRLAPLGPNDGGGILLADALRLPGYVIPIWGADHYLNPAWNFAPTLRNILLQTAMSHTTASATPATRSTA